MLCMIVGLWPDYNDGSWPACCTKSNFEEKLISTLHETLEKYWPSLSCGSSSTCHGGKGSLLEHEDLILCSLSFLFNLSLYTIQTNFYSFLCSCLLGMAEMGDIQCQWASSGRCWIHSV
ncbi:hypothetical protein ACB092_12G190000 [Castanea dentata]